jgi:glutathione S-transferase
VNFADVQPLSKQIGAPPTTTYSDGSPRYTLPTIHDPNTGRTVSDTLEIARYLDKQYPDRKIFPAGSEDLQSEFANSAGSLNGTASVLSFPHTQKLMSKPNQK